MDEKTIKEGLLKGERITLECKKAKAEVPKEFWNTYSAFANTIGGLNVVKDVVKDVVKELTERQKVILKLIKENPSLSASEMSQKTGMVTRTIQRDLASLHEKGFLTREGGRKDGKWVIRK